jgi:hypothetical protein
MDRRNTALQEDAIRLAADFTQITKTIIQFLQIFFD